MATSAERQRAFRARKKEQGLVQVTGLVTSRQAAAVQLLLAALRDNPHLEVGPLKDSVSGRYVRL